LPRQKGGFTLAELVIVIIIIAILAALAIPRFIRTAEKAKGDESVANLRLIFAGERMYRLDYNIYSSNLVTGPGPDDGGLSPEYIEDVTTAARQKYFIFEIVPNSLGATLQTFRARAQRNSGIYSGGWIEIDQDENITTGDGWPW